MSIGEMNNIPQPTKQINKVVVGGQTIIDLTKGGTITETAVNTDIRSGVQAWNCDGVLLTGELVEWMPRPLYIDNLSITGTSSPIEPGWENGTYSQVNYFQVDTCETKTDDTNGFTYYVGDPVPGSMNEEDELTISGSEGNYTVTLTEGTPYKEEILKLFYYYTPPQQLYSVKVDVTVTITGVEGSVITFNSNDAIPDNAKATVRYYKASV